MYSLHSLLEEGEFPGLTDDQIGPLHNHNGHEERRVAGVLETLPLGIRLQHKHNSLYI